MNKYDKICTDTHTHSHTQAHKISSFTKNMDKNCVFIADMQHDPKCSLNMLININVKHY